MLRQREEGGEQWLLALRGQTLDEAVTSLCTLPGIGPKVAACIALFSLDQHHAIPVDTHVWQVCLNRHFIRCRILFAALKRLTYVGLCLRVKP